MWLNLFNFLIDSAVPVLLYVGKTCRSNKRWKGEYDCKRYVESYQALHYRYRLKATVNIAFWFDTPSDCRARQDLEISLILKWCSRVVGAERKELLAKAQTRAIDLILVTELSRWGRSLTDLVGTVEFLESRGVSLLTQSGLQFDLATAQGRLIASIFGAIAEFEAELIRERIKSGLANAKAKGKKLGRQPGVITPRIQRLTPKVLTMVEEGLSYRRIACELKLAKNTVIQIVKRSREA
jgi:putative DNA-invertase from lambdoid prophage Rac